MMDFMGLQHKIHCDLPAIIAGSQIIVKNTILI